MRRSSRVLLGSAAGLSIAGWLFAVGCGSDDDNTTSPAADASSDSTSPPANGDATTPPSGDDATTGDDDATTPPGGDGGDEDASIEDAGHDATVGETDGATHEDGGDASLTDSGDAGIHDASTDHDAGDADAGDASTAVPYRLIGRWDTSTPGTLNADWPGTGIITKFSNTATTSVKLNITDVQYAFDPNNGSGTGDYIDVYVDNNAVSRLAVASDNGTPGVMTIATGIAATTLAAPTHTIKVFKSTDMTAGKISLTIPTGSTTPFTFSATGSATVNATYTFDHKLEFIGDDQLAGIGDYTTACNTGAGAGGVTPANSDENTASPYLVSSFFNAEHTTLAGGDFGVYIDGQTTTTFLVKNLFPLTLPSQSINTLPNPETWTYANYQPEVVILNIGGIADATALGATTPTETAAQFETAYASFLTTLHSAAVYPNAKILVTVGPSVFGTNLTATELNTYTAAAITQFSAAAGNTTAVIEKLDLTGVETFGCGYRPGSADYIAAAGKIEQTLEATPYNLTP